MRSLTIVPLAIIALLGVPAVAGKAKQTRYVGIHPVPAAAGGGFCYIEGPHVHIFAANNLEYRDHEHAHYFVGDPVAYGYDGPRHAYMGHHPIHVNVVVGDPHDDVEFCYLNGPHFHSFEPAVAADFEVRGDAYFYVAEPPPVYIEARPALVKINAVYTPIEYVRPVVTVEPPAAWVGVRFAMPAAVVVDAPAAAVVDVRGPRVRAGVDVVIPAPSISVDIGVGIGGGVYVGGGGRGKVKYKHDNGKHKGWRKHR